MAVAKSYQNLEIVKEPYMANGRMYVQIKLGNGSTKQVRWYSDKEYAKFYPGEKVDHSNDAFHKTQKDVLGFTKGYITIFKGDTYSCKDWFKEHGARYARFWGWYIISEMEVPAELPEGIEAIQLNWESVGNEDGSLKNEDLVKQTVDSLTYEADESQFVGTIGQRLELEVYVEKAIHLDNGYYGPSTMHIMRDADGNAYVWTTASKSWSEGSFKQIRGTVKDHKTYRNVNQTVLTRCAEIKSK